MEPLMSRRYRAETGKGSEFSDRAVSRGFFGKPTLVVFWVFVLAACLAVAIPALPQYQLLKKIETELADAEREEQRLLNKSKQLQAEARALKKNPRYLEERARDPLRYMREGETIIQFRD